MGRTSLFVITIIILLAGCTRDDICTQETPTTPLLIITFNDVANPSQRKAVPSLTVETTEASPTTVIDRLSTDSIAIPLRNSTSETAYRFRKGDGTSEPNLDFVRFTYSTEDIYVNRACAFKTVYKELNMIRQSEGSANWILQFNVLNTEVLDETTTHITVFH